MGTNTLVAPCLRTPVPWGVAVEREVRWTSCDSGMCTVTAVAVAVFLLRGSFPFS